jgi:uncharacterized protein YprB with RNaseH-like and TPR domain
MGSNLRSRLRRIREAGASGKPGGSSGTAGSAGAGPETPPGQDPLVPGDDWIQAGYLSAKRTLFLDAPPFPPVFPPSLGILVPDLLRYTPGGAGPGTLLFFDLETTGLSSGAGVAAFLAAFGRLVSAAGETKLEVTQYLLLDYPGEDAFLEAVLGEFRREGAGGPPLAVTYNGKTFDAQVLKTRCLVNGRLPPVFFHADLLHPARRLWKRILPSCSQGEIETAVLGLDRTGDTPGAMAPDIWFAFLKTGETAALRGVCDHNVRDISGLARLFSALARIAEDPLGACSVYPYDLESLALHWRRACRPKRGHGEGPLFGGGLPETGKALLSRAASQGRPLAALTLARDLFRAGEHETGRGHLRRIAAGEHPPYVRALAFRTLAVDAERRLRDPALALSYTEAALTLYTPASGIPALPLSLREDLALRRDRLVKKRENNIS